MTALVTRNRALPGMGDFLGDVLAGLRRVPKQLPCKYFYDARGSELFDRICRLEEYYLTRTELCILDQHADAMGAQIGPGAMLVEYGSGSSVKTRYLLDALPDVVAYAGVDVAEEHLHRAARELARDYPLIEILSVVADFTEEFALPIPRRRPTHTAIYFPGSTIGNFMPAEATELLRGISRRCGRGGGLLIGIDLKKDTKTLEAAYNDRLGVTALFNLNLLQRINRELGADFDLAQFAHRAVYNDAQGRIEMSLVSRCSQVVTIADQRIEFEDGEAICTEYSHKYAVEEFAAMAATAGLELRREWTDRNRLVAVLHFAVVDDAVVGEASTSPVNSHRAAT